MDDGTDFAIYDHDSHELFSLNYGRTPTIQGDVALATATPPQTFNLPMAEGFTAYPGYACIYHKTQFGEIGIQIIAQYVGTGTIGIKLLAILPEGFRPAYHCEFPMVVNFDGQQSIALITVDADGGIYLHSYSSATNNGAAVSGYARFIAAG